MEINRLEKYGAWSTCRLADFFRTPSDIPDSLKWREIYGIGETATDRAKMW